ncbi:MAG: PepSY domain-containing protein [Deltaproteobacteria bacterium]|nr:PepSY domain-containing protein [Deltaproteobacteria bacterium]
MLRKFWLQVHWLLGITAGVVLAVMGVTGALLSFEQDLLRWMNPGVITVPPRADGPLTPQELLARIQTAFPEKRLIGLELSADPHAAARVGFASSVDSQRRQGRPTGQGGRRRTEWRYVDPYTGAALGEPWGQEFFRFTTELHRWLAAGDTGKAITGASTLALIVLCLSGLYLRWPRRMLNWRTWLTFDFTLTGRAFLWRLHAVTGTWVLLLYLLAGLTGLFWSYEWYRNGLMRLTGAPPPNRERMTVGAPLTVPLDFATVWAAFLHEVGEFHTATVSLPEHPAQAVEIRYLEPRPAHERAFSQLVLHPVTGAVLQHDRYAKRSLGGKLITSMFVLHSGTFFGVVGWALMMVASLIMPLFAITGWQLYLARRAKKRASLLNVIGSEEWERTNA